MIIKDGQIILNYTCIKCQNVYEFNMFPRPVNMPREVYLNSIEHTRDLKCPKCNRKIKHTLAEDLSKIP